MAKKKKATDRQLTRRGRGAKSTSAAKVPKKLVADLRKMIDESRQVVSQTVVTGRLKPAIERRLKTSHFE